MAIQNLLNFSQCVSILYEGINRKVPEGFAPDVREGGANQVVYQRPYDREARLPGQVYHAVEHLF